MKITVCKGCKDAISDRAKKNPRTGRFLCFTCIGLNPSSGVPEEVEMPEKTKCRYCHKEVNSKPDLPFYNSGTNTFYCGCRGWR